MTTRTHASKRFPKHPDDSLQYGYIFDDVLPSGVTISSIGNATPYNISGTATPEITVTGAAVNAAAFDDDDGVSVPIGRAVRGLTAGGAAGSVWGVEVKITASNGEVYAGDWVIDVEGPPSA